MPRSGGQEVIIFFLASSLEEYVPLRGLGVKYHLTHHLAGGACVAPGVGRYVSSSP